MVLETKGARRGPKPKPHTRDSLIRAGVQMLHDSGYTATGIKDVVDAAEVPKGSFYNHFESKESFGAEIVDFYFESGFVELRALLCNPDLGPIERLRAYFEERIRGYESAGYMRGCMLGNLSLEVADHSALIRERLEVHFKTWSGLIEDCIAEAQQRGDISNRMRASMLAQFLLNSWEGALLRMRVEKSDGPLRDFVKVIFESVLV
ncbi:TetR family transcriptional regulator C-terminal domain-containing protein [Cupriavidus sp. CV2]|uniref:TetR/AcrR family transcriptional regulator n=2 Tax=Cupriavidus ulmosensis TaxID=3065913 RepID=UPI00296AF1F2|nr:TetR family transcriptional regulator C-terminal domain-containing protein [Cupriavidus sp. CV2]MDW3689206.1 TetR family transcriptional regulator C-terminal domain-containing protein [Cupriavidus sp. CV2]